MHLWNDFNMCIDFFFIESMFFFWIDFVVVCLLYYVCYIICNFCLLFCFFYQSFELCTKLYRIFNWRSFVSIEDAVCASSAWHNFILFELSYWKLLNCNFSYFLSNYWLYNNASVFFLHRMSLFRKCDNKHVFNSFLYPFMIIITVSLKID